MEEITRLQKQAWTDFMQDCKSWGITIHRVCGAENVKRAYEEIARGGVPPDQGLIWSMWEEDTMNTRL